MIENPKTPEPYKYIEIMDKTTVKDFSPNVAGYFKNENISNLRLVMMNHQVYDYFTKRIGFTFRPPMVAVDMDEANVSQLFKPEAKEIIDYNFDQKFVITMPNVEKIDLKIEGQLVHEITHYLQIQKEKIKGGSNLILSEYIHQEHEKQAIIEEMRYFKSKKVNSYNKVMAIMTEENHILADWEKTHYLKLWNSL